VLHAARVSATRRVTGRSRGTTSSEPTGGSLPSASWGWSSSSPLRSSSPSSFGPNATACLGTLPRLPSPSCFFECLVSCCEAPFLLNTNLCVQDIVPVHSLPNDVPVPGQPQRPLVAPLAHVASALVCLRLRHRLCRLIHRTCYPIVFLFLVAFFC
jgi:hypothetical protein